MRQRLRIALLATCLTAGCCAYAFGQSAHVLKQRKLSRWDIAPANYSGITHVGGEVYALVTDKPRADGYQGLVFLRIQQSDVSGQITRVEELTPLDACKAAGISLPADSLSRGTSVGRDAEGLCFVEGMQTFFVSDEADSSVREYDAGSHPTGRSLQVPGAFAADSIVQNRGLEALCYDLPSRRFFTTTEAPLRADGGVGARTLRLQSFGDGLEADTQYIYRLDSAELSPKARLYAHGVSGMCALGDGRLVVLEREVRVPKNYFGARCRCKLYAVLPASSVEPLNKELLCTFTTRLTLLRTALANYEGLCPGIRLRDGRQTLLLISDSQGRAGRGPYRLRDYMRVCIIDK